MVLEYVQLSKEVLFHDVLKQETSKPNFGPRVLKHIYQQVTL